jgi:hypothetical protein
VPELDERNSDLEDGEAGRPGPRERRWPRRIALTLLIVLGLAAIGGGASGLVVIHDRKPTPAQVTAAGQRALAQQWRWLTAGKIFPATVSYDSNLGFQMTAVLVGIAPQAPCATAFDKAAARVLDAAGCVTVLRATYADQSGTALATVGIAVMRGTGAADSAFGKVVRGNLGGLLPVSFPGTIASWFTRGARETDGVQETSSPYLVFYAAGYADGRSTTSGAPLASGGNTSTGETVTGDLANSLTDALVTTFTVPANPCADREVRC